MATMAKHFHVVVCLPVLFARHSTFRGGNNDDDDESLDRKEEEVGKRRISTRERPDVLSSAQFSSSRLGELPFGKSGTR